MKEEKTTTLAAFFNEVGCNQLWVCSTAQPTGYTVTRDADDNEVFESCCTNPDFWELRGEVDDLGRWDCLGDDLRHCCDYAGNNLTRLVALPAK